MGNTRLKEVTGQSPILSFKEDGFWIIPDQFIGLEIEIENYSDDQLYKHEKAGSPFWERHNDGSLRNGTEFVLSQAMMGTTLREAISYFFRTFTTYEATPRTSIHVHLNMRQENETIEGLRNLIILYYMYEDAFFAIADNNRKWCSYCNPFEDSPPRILEVLVNEELNSSTLAKELRSSAATNQNRYYGLNLNALNKFGTIEFRHFPLVHDETRLVDWVNLIMELKLAANTMAEEGLTVWQVFNSPDDIPKLKNYMPRFGELLLSSCDSARAFTRMANVRGLAVRETRRHGLVKEDQLAFATFLAEKRKTLKTKAPTARVNKKNLGAAPTVGDFQTLLNPFDNEAQQIEEAVTRSRLESEAELTREDLRRTVERMGMTLPDSALQNLSRNARETWVRPSRETRAIRMAVPRAEIGAVSSSLTGPTFVWGEPDSDEDF